MIETAWNSGMVIDYVIELPCEPKRRFGRTGLLDLLRRIELYRADPRPSPELQEAAQDAGFLLRPHAFHCRECPANHSQRPFGCYGRIECPISAEGEAWLHSLCPRSLRRSPAQPEAERQRLRAFHHLLRELEARGVTGAGMDARRRDGRKLLERRTPMVRRYGFWRNAVRVSSSQLLELMFGGEYLTSELGELLCRALGLWEDGEVGGDGLPEAIFNATVEHGDDGSTADLKDFLYALVIGASVDSGVGVLLLEAKPGELAGVAR